MHGLKFAGLTSTSAFGVLLRHGFGSSLLLSDYTRVSLEDWISLENMVLKQAVLDLGLRRISFGQQLRNGFCICEVQHVTILEVIMQMGAVDIYDPA